MDPAAAGSAVQPPNGGDPQAGQPAGGEGQGGIADLYDLSTAPEELRPYLQEQLEKVNQNVEQKFREAADFRKRWEPFEGVEGLDGVPADELKELVEFRELASDPEQFEDWWEAIGEKLGFFGDEGAGGENGGGPEGGPDGEEPPAWATQLIERVQGLEQGLDPIKQHVTQDEQRQRQETAQADIRTALDGLKAQHAEAFKGADGQDDPEVESAICKLAFSYPDKPANEAIPLAFQDYLSITGKAQGQLADAKLGQPGPALSGGQADTSAEEFDGLGDPALKKAAKARFAGAGVR